MPVKSLGKKNPPKFDLGGYAGLPSGPGNGWNLDFGEFAKSHDFVRNHFFAGNGFGEND